MTPDTTITYCTNIHPARGLAGVMESIDGVSAPLRARLAPAGVLPIGLRLSDAESRELDEPRALDSFAGFLAERGLAVACMNGFPFGDFSGAPVKDAVHRPDWADERRVAYTLRLARLLAALLPVGAPGGISTSPLTYRPWGEPSADRRRAMTTNIARVAAEFSRLSRETGRDLHLAIEPEPDGLIETAGEFTAWFTRELGRIASARPFAMNAEELRARIRVCLDACHSAVLFEEPAAALDEYARAGVRIGRVQVSGALDVMIPARRAERAICVEALAPYAEPTYLHQTIGRRDDGALVRWRDLPEAIAALAQTDAARWRIHYHVPIFWAGAGVLSTTQPCLRELLRLVRARGACALFEIETYTWAVLPAYLRRDLVDSIEREWRWLGRALDSFTTPGESV